MVFSGILLLALLAVTFPEMAVQGLQGILWTGAGLLMILLPPVVRVPRAWYWLAAGFLLFSLVGFLPREWFRVSAWRSDLETLGLDTGRSAFVQARLAAETMAGFAATTLVTLFLLGHRVGSRDHHRLVLGFALGVGIWTTAALLLQKPGGLFGFFPNRNHTATLLAMGTFAGLGSLVQAIRLKAPWQIALSVPPIILTIWVLFAVSESRAGVVLLAIGFVAWLLLAGARAFRGNVGKALILLVMAAVGAFFIVDSPVKKRLTATVEKLAPAAPETVEVPEQGDDPAAAQESPFAMGREAIQAEPQMDARVSIFRAALDMSGREPWTGVGPGCFASVFSQYRETADAPNDSRFLHPESDWLMMLTETGWLATLCLLAGVLAVFFEAIRQARGGRARFLKTAGIVSALLPCIHGIFDVPGHRIGLAWAAALMLATALRPAACSSGGHAAELRWPSPTTWRALGLAVLACGVMLLVAQWSRSTVLPSTKARHHMQNAKNLYDQDQAAYDKATAESLKYDPPADQDPLEAALREVAEAIRIAPLDPHPHYIQGALALHYDDKQEIARRAFAIQRRLDPTRVNTAMEQARAWKEQNPDEVLTLWKEALRRARAQQTRFPDGPVWVANTYRRALVDAGKNESLSFPLLELAAGDSSLVQLWANSATPALLDREMPRLLESSQDAATRRPLFQSWQSRGSKPAVQAFAEAHPELLPAHP